MRWAVLENVLPLGASCPTRVLRGPSSASFNCALAIACHISKLARLIMAIGVVLTGPELPLCSARCDALGCT